jgi:DNA-nicking Smr family endonuclease
MSKRKKGRKVREFRELSQGSVRFEIEENAEELFLKHLDEFKPENKDADERVGLVAPKRTRSRSHVLDLHGMQLMEAEDFVRHRLNELLAIEGSFSVKIVTGKGRHSENKEGVLVKEIHGFVLRYFREHIASIEESPDKLRLRGEPIRGHFHVTFHGRKAGLGCSRKRNP